MPLLITTAAAAVCAPISLLVWILLTGDRASRKLVQQNLSRDREHPNQKKEYKQGLLSHIGEKLTPEGYAARLDTLLALAGRPSSLTLPRLMSIKPLLAIAGALVGILIAWKDPSSFKLMLAAVIPLTAYFVPDLLLRSRGQERQAAITMELPNVLDQVLISVEAGLGFESAMWRAGRTGKGPLAEEIARTLQDMQVGRSRREAYAAMAERTASSDLRSFIRAVIQADTYGVAIAKVLRIQATEMRTKRRQRAEEKAMKIPVKILFPLMFFIMPVLFIVIMGPAVLGIIETFSGGGL